MQARGRAAKKGIADGYAEYRATSDGEYSVFRYTRISISPFLDD